MKALLTTILFSTALVVFSQSYEYEPSSEYPFGRLNPDAPSQTGDFSKLIGKCSCKSVSRIGPKEWADTVSTIWTFKYIMNGTAVQDETLKEDGRHSGSIRQFNADSSKWYVHYYSSSSAVTTLPAWEGNKMEGDDIVLFRQQTSPNGLEGYYRLTFSDISDDGFNWIGEWVNKNQTIVYPTWKIFCLKTD